MNPISLLIGHGGLERQGSRWRIDRVYVSPELAPTITDVQVGDADTVGALSDHLRVLLTLDPDKVRALVRPRLSHGRGELTMPTPRTTAEEAVTRDRRAGRVPAGRAAS
ncbi:hypothetical protein ACFY8W_03920 [Streptomyces sp. NPDC012637]|uniref:hypothetical protein n=1 Tax=Streptomyces sp. NPDC012637 TaxID=3364842 RepID=UPI0036E4F0DC